MFLHCRKNKTQVQSASDTTQSEGVHHRVEFYNGFLSLGETEDAEMQIIKFCQRKIYAEEISCLQRGESVKQSTHIYELNPVLEDYVLQVGRCLSRAMEKKFKAPCHNR